MFTAKNLEEAVSDRRFIHAHPELKYEEFSTSKMVADRLRQLGYDVTENIAETGVVGLLDTGKPGKVIALRADMDALPIVEKNKFQYISKNHGKMHACGHDGHTATLLLAAKEIIARREHLKGCIKLIFQPAEEGGNGAEKMVKAGVLENPKVDNIFGYHNRPGFESGFVFAKKGSAMGGNDTFHLTIQGKSGHAAMPSLAVDPILIGSSIVMNLQGIVARVKSPLKAGVITVGRFISGDKADNIIPDTAELSINIRSDSPESRSQLVDNLDKLINGICETFGASYSLKHVHSIPPLVNPAEPTERLIDVVKQKSSELKVELIDYMPTMGAEDFSFYLEKVPGCFFFVGNGIDSAYLHNDHYDFNDDILPIAASVFVNIVESYCGLEAE